MLTPPQSHAVGIFLKLILACLLYATCGFPGSHKAHSPSFCGSEVGRKRRYAPPTFYRDACGRRDYLGDSTQHTGRNSRGLPRSRARHIARSKICPQLGVAATQDVPRSTAKRNTRRQATTRAFTSVHRFGVYALTSSRVSSELQTRIHSHEIRSPTHYIPQTISRASVDQTNRSLRLHKCVKRPVLHHLSGVARQPAEPITATCGKHLPRAIGGSRYSSSSPMQQRPDPRIEKASSTQHTVPSFIPISTTYDGRRTLATRRCFFIVLLIVVPAFRDHRNHSMRPLLRSARYRR